MKAIAWGRGRLLLVASAIGWVVAAAGASTLPSCAEGQTVTDLPSDDSGAGAGDSCNCDPGFVCNPDNGECVDCLPSADDCPEGQYCTPDNTCADGCGDNADCDPQLCDPATHECVDCLESTDCEDGFVCVDGGCVEGCLNTLDCSSMEEVCCSELCVNTQTDLANCGGCGNECPTIQNADTVCMAGTCNFGGCLAGWADCNLDASDGCEWDVTNDGPCTCEPDEQIPCYEGPLGTDGIGTCAAGVATCASDGLGYGDCEDQVLPTFDTCGDNLNQDCTGTDDDPPDLDGDGYAPCTGDCCETIADCTLPKLVNAGAFEVDGNTLDDDCDGTDDNVLATCDGALVSNSATAMDYAKAMDLCQQTSAGATGANKKWGVTSAIFRLADDAGTPASNSKSIRQTFGDNVNPFAGDRITVMSTGHAADANDVSPPFASFQGGQDMAKSSAVPADWIAANANNFPNAPGCPEPQGGTTANDPIMLHLEMRVPTNAYSFAVSTFLYSSEYPEWVCSPFNDFFLALLDSQFVADPALGEVDNPADKNLATYTDPLGNKYPIGVNLAFGDTGLFTVCKNGPTGCGLSSVPGSTTSCVATAQLNGTSFETVNPPPHPDFTGEPGYCGTNNLLGGGTGWLTMRGNVEPGEIIDLRFVIWDTGDPWYDSLVLLDNFQWSVNAAEPGVHD